MPSQSPLFARAIQLFSQGDYSQAISVLQQVVASEPAQIEPRLNLAKACLDWVLTQAQVPLTELDPDTLDTQASHHLHLAEAQLGALAKSHPALPHVQGLLAMVHLIRSRPDEALRCLKKALVKDPSNPDLLYNVGYALMELERFAEAVAQFKRLTALHPGHGMGWQMLGEANRHAGNPETALPAYHRAITLLPGWFQPYGALGSALRDLGRTAEAMDAFQRGLLIQPDNVDLNLALANCALSSGAWAMGWRHYACRWGDGPRFPFQDGYVIPLQPGHPVRVHWDQGLGDELFFLRFASVLAGRGMTLQYATNRKLFPLLQGQSALAELKISDKAESESYDVLAGELPYLAGMRATADIPPPLPLSPDKGRVDTLRTALSAFGSPPYLGITWRGGTAKKACHKGAWRILHKEIPPARLGKLARTWPGTVVVLQRQPGQQELAGFSKALGRPCLDWSGLNDDLQEVIAGLSLLDEYVGVSNTNMHLLAGLGKTARVLVPQPAEWRWMAVGDESPWFPGFRIYRQLPGKNWDGALKKLAQDLVEKYPPRGTPQ